jgi:hypothetical protein
VIATIALVIGIYIFGAVIAAAIVPHLLHGDGMSHGGRCAFVGVCVVLWPLMLTAFAVAAILIGVGQLILGDQE